MSQSDRFRDVFEGDEVARFLGQFVLAEPDRSQKIAADPKGGWQHFPASVDDALKDLKQVWQEKGFLTPSETRAALMDKYLPDASQHVKTLLHEIEKSRDMPEPGTGYLGKEHAYIATGLAHLYALEGSGKIAMIEADFSNMGGTNDFFRDKLAAERGVDARQIPASEYFALTDKAMRVLSQSLTETLQDHLPAGSKIVPIRTGGDELRLIVTGIETPEQAREITALLHMNTEKHVAAMGLQDHPHLKAPKDETRNGFGVAVAIQDMATIENTHTVIQDLDGQIKSVKSEIGLTRLGKIDRDIARAEIEQQLESGDLYIRDGMTRGQFIRDEISRREAEARTAAGYLHGMNPQHNKSLENSIAGYEAYVAQHMGPPDPPNPLTGLALDAIQNVKGAQLMDSLHERRMNAVEKIFEVSGDWPNGAARHMVAMAVKGLDAQDPSAQVLMPQMLAPTVAALAAEMDAYRLQFDPNDKAVQKALKIAGMEPESIGVPMALTASFHNLGGMNALLGHHNSDLVLREMGRIVEQSLIAAGVPGGEPKPYSIAHYGGACFTAIVKPGVMQEDGTPLFISQKMIQKAEMEIEKRVHELNRTPIAEFLAKNGAVADQNLHDFLAREGAKTFEDIKDPKIRKTDIEGTKIEGRVNGIHVGTMTSAIEATAMGDAHSAVDGMKQQCDGRVEQRRHVVIVRDFLAEVIKGIGKPLGDSMDHMAAALGAEQGQRDRRVMEAFGSIPASPDGTGMPPEVQALSIFKHKAITAGGELAKIEKSGKGKCPEREKWQHRLDNAMRRFGRQYDELAQGGGLVAVAKFLQVYTPPEAHVLQAPSAKSQTKFIPKGTAPV